MIVAAAVSVAVFIALAFFLGRGCQPGEEPATTVTVTASTATSTQPTTGTQVASSSQPAPAAPAEPEPAAPTTTEEPSPALAAPLSIADASWSCENYSSMPDNEGCVSDYPVDWMVLISGGDPVSVTVTLTGPQPTPAVSLIKGGLHEPGSPAYEWYATAPAPHFQGTYYYSVTVVESSGATTVVSSDPMLGTFTLPVAFNIHVL